MNAPSFDLLDDVADAIEGKWRPSRLTGEDIARRLRRWAERLRERELQLIKHDMASRGVPPELVASAKGGRS